MRFHWFAAHLLFTAAVSIPRSVAAVPKPMGTPSAPRWLTINLSTDLSFARNVDLQDRVRPSLAVPSFTALPISAASCNNFMRLVLVTNSDRSSMCSSKTDRGTTYSYAWTNSSTRPLAQEQLWRQNAKMLDAQPVMMSLYPSPTCRHLGDLCVREPKTVLKGVTSCHQLWNQQMCFGAVIEFPHVPKEVDHTLTFAAGQIPALRAELPLSAESHSPANLTSH